MGITIGNIRIYESITMQSKLPGEDTEPLDVFMITLEILAARKLERKVKRKTSLRQPTFKGTTRCSGADRDQATDGLSETMPLPSFKASDCQASKENKFQKVIKGRTSSCTAAKSSRSESRRSESRRSEWELVPLWLRRWRLMGKEWKSHFGLDDNTDVNGKKLDGTTNNALKVINTCSSEVKAGGTSNIGGNRVPNSVLEVSHPTRRCSRLSDFPSKKEPCDKRQVGRSHPYQENFSQENKVVSGKDAKCSPKSAAKRQHNNFYKEKSLRAELEKLQAMDTAATYRDHRLRKQKEDLLIRELSKYDVNKTLLDNIDVVAQNVLCSPKAEETDNSGKDSPKCSPKPAAKRQHNKEKSLRAALKKLQALDTAATYREHRLRKQKEDILIRELSKYDANKTLLDNIDVVAQNVLCSPKTEETDSIENSSVEADSSQLEIEDCETKPTSQEFRRDSVSLRQSSSLSCDQPDSASEDSVGNMQEDDPVHRESTGVSAEPTERLQDSSVESRSDELVSRHQKVHVGSKRGSSSENDSILRDIAPDLARRLSAAMRNGRYDNTIKESRKRKSPSDEYRNYLPSKKPFYTGFVGYYERF